MRYWLCQHGIRVGIAAVHSEENVSYCLIESLRNTKTCTLAQLKKKYKLELFK